VVIIVKGERVILFLVVRVMICIVVVKEVL